MTNDEIFTSLLRTLVFNNRLKLDIEENKKLPEGFNLVDYLQTIEALLASLISNMSQENNIEEKELSERFITANREYDEIREKIEKEREKSQ
jgi:hypothetical protein